VSHNASAIVGEVPGLAGRIRDPRELPIEEISLSRCKYGHLQLGDRSFGRGKDTGGHVTAVTLLSC
jgi:hypothetical protein